MQTSSKLENFQRNVASKFHIYNSVFITLPFDAIDNTGVLLPLFTEICETGFKNRWTPLQTIQAFRSKYLTDATDQELHDLLFRFIQYVERQIVLFDAVEDAAFAKVNPMEGRGSLREMIERAETKDKKAALTHFLKHFKVRTVLTAHPTQFYPGSVLGIITDLTEAIREDDLLKIKQLLAQLGKTPFIKKQKPTPYDEATSLIWYLEHVFYHTTSSVLSTLQKNVLEGQELENCLLNLGFWPGGDRDGNPFVTANITLQVADRLRQAIVRCYYADIRKLKRKLTFKSVDRLVADLEFKLYQSLYHAEENNALNIDHFHAVLGEIAGILQKDHQSLYLEDVLVLSQKMRVFGLHFATLDIRQNSQVHEKVFAGVFDAFSKKGAIAADASKDWALDSLLNIAEKPIQPVDFGDPLIQSTLESILAMRHIQSVNGEMGCNRYIISNNETSRDVLEIYTLFQLCGWHEPTVDFVPLFESVNDLQEAATVMEALYNDPKYSDHLGRRNRRQTVMLGFSDGTKDGGYLMANWSIFKAKESITSMSRQYGIEVIFFDGRGGPPARGGGKTHKFYASLGSTIENNEIQLTIQGQTISSNFGTLDSCRWNLENLISAGAQNDVFLKEKNNLTTSEKAILDEMAQIGYEAYTAFKARPEFLPYLEHMSTLPYYALTNIGSRPAKRNAGSSLDFAALRAIPFVGSWSQLKQNVPGFFGVGSALDYFEQQGRWHEVQKLYHRSLFFRTLLENSMMALAKSFFPLTAYMEQDPEFGSFWQLIHNEYELSKKWLLKLADHEELMENYPDGKASVALREQIVKPLLAIQQYALFQLAAIRRNEQDKKDEEVYKKLVTRSLFGNTNASRNSA
ncbi:MAG: phosphoenolpyruvate carboxylase [Flavobacterium sp. BFFFF2]|nr:MAG: phosphoenolpyruvate carboxylase [Flavobacterium sp. BFFFF2]